MFKKAIATIGFLLLVIACIPLQAQDIRVKASVNKDRILIGEHIVLQLEAEVPAGSDLKWFRTDSIPSFEYVDRDPVDTTSSVSGNLYRQMLIITSFDSGSLVIPRMSLTVNNSRYLTDSINIEVGYSPVEANQPYHDIKDIIDVPEVEPMYINYIIAVATILAIAALIWYLRRRKTSKQGDAAPSVTISPFEKAMAALSAMKGYDHLDAPGLKNYYIRINDILRDYFRERNLVNSPDSSNEKLVVAVKQRLDTETVYRLAQSLRLADAVKFAKYLPDGQETHKVYDDIHSTIRIVEESYLQEEALKRQEAIRQEQLKQNKN
ncbi:BatD family protein [Flavihumibacter sp. ZG627]|uniref:BatD family protein n=1 Tax=Flavihumibacter sp. ZG627 TaxID=1463156 RepID=UPI00057FBC47|nr:BatD family protein [Flavihumibacter sp. ZG627]KIC89172.1 hypothetical protein HY58_18135 [Flavihumibacter sp. ZG627]